MENARGSLRSSSRWRSRVARSLSVATRSSASFRLSGTIRARNRAIQQDSSAFLRLEVDEEARGPEFRDLVDLLFNGEVEGRVLTLAELERKPLDIESSPPQNSPRSTQKDLDRAQDVARMLRA